MPLSRQLAAIMFTDIVGYTALMGDDEEKALNYWIKTGIFINRLSIYTMEN